MLITPWSGMKNIKIFPIILIILVSILMGCTEKTPSGTLVPTVAPTPDKTVLPTAVATTTPTPTPVTTPFFEPINYRVSVESGYGFYKVRAIKGNSSYDLPFAFDVRNFSINVGDSVRWINEDNFNFRLTIVSNESLWTGETGRLRWPGDRFEYTFNESGTYRFSIKEFKRLEPQKIIVNPRE